MVNRELCGFRGVVGATEAEGGHELYEGREGRHRGRWRRGRSEAEAGRQGLGRRQGEEEAGWGQPWTMGPWLGNIMGCRLGNEARESGCHERA